MKLLLDVIAFLIRWIVIATIATIVVTFFCYNWQIALFVFAFFVLLALIGWAFERKFNSLWK